MTQQVLVVTIGVDTHVDVHVAAAVDAVGVVLADASALSAEPSAGRGGPWTRIP